MLLVHWLCLLPARLRKAALQRCFLELLLCRCRLRRDVRWLWLVGWLWLLLVRWVQLLALLLEGHNRLRRAALRRWGSELVLCPSLL